MGDPSKHGKLSTISTEIARTIVLRISNFAKAGMALARFTNAAIAVARIF